LWQELGIGEKRVEDRAPAAAPPPIQPAAYLPRTEAATTEDAPGFVGVRQQGALLNRNATSREAATGEFMRKQRSHWLFYRSPIGKYKQHHTQTLT
jgi:hypothetical protein